MYKEQLIMDKSPGTGCPESAEEVPIGYKRTKVGVIPEEWEVNQLGEMATFYKGAGLSKADLHPDGANPCIHYGELFTTYDYRIVDVVSYTNRDGSWFYSQTNDVLMPTSDVTPNGLATASCITVSGVILGGDILVIRVPDSVLNGEFLAYLVKINRNQIMQLVSGTTVFHLYGRDMANFVFPTPSVEEQTAIVKALSDVDELTGALGKLIAKKRAIKLAAMQQLLTGKTRLPGFSGEWESVTLGDIAVVLKGSGLSKNVIIETGARKCVLYGELFTTYGTLIDDVNGRTDSEDGYPSNVGDVLMPGSTTTIGVDLAKASALMEEGVALGGDINIIRPYPDGKVSSPFLADVLTEIKKDEIAKRTQGITIIHLYGKDLLNLDLDLPSVTEQQAIVTILSDMDEEIAALERRLEKTKAIKQGMMQSLLTGRVRLVKPETIT